jgi:hypothetical protein
MNKNIIILCVLCGIILSSCGIAPTAPVPPTPVLVTADPNALPTPTPFQPIAATLVPLESPTLIPTFTPEPPTNTPLPTFAFTATSLIPPTVPPQTARTQYTLFTLLDYAGHQLAVDETVIYTNQTGVSLNELVLAVEPNLRSGFSLEHILLDGNALTYDLSGQRLTVRLPGALAPNAQATLAMRFSLAIPPKSKDHPYGYDADQANLTDWYPFVVPYNNGWVLHDVSGLGEHLVYDAADFEVNIKTTGVGVTIAASGLEEPASSGSAPEWTRYRLSGGRTFAFSASDRFFMKESAVGLVVIRSYYFEGYEGAGQGMLNASVKAVGLFKDLFAPYPYTILNVVQSNLNDGQEYDGLVFLATKFYDDYGGSEKSNLVTIGVHEIAHQWWFGLVGSDQALEPWLDEALCVYSENIFYEYIHPNYGDWWWNFRVNYFGPSGWVDTNIYEGGSFRGYVNAAYLNGANFMDELRWRMGMDDFLRFLKDYASRYGRGHATAADFFAVAEQNTTADISDLVRAYFKGSY